MYTSLDLGNSLASRLEWLVNNNTLLSFDSFYILLHLNIQS